MEKDNNYTFFGGIGLFTAFLCMPLILVCSVWYFSCLLKWKRTARGKRAHVMVCGSVSRIRSLEKEAKTELLIWTLTESFITSLPELTSCNPWLPVLLYTTEVNSFAERHLKHLTPRHPLTNSPYSHGPLPAPDRLTRNALWAIYKRRTHRPPLALCGQTDESDCFACSFSVLRQSVWNRGKGSGRYFVWFFCLFFVLFRFAATWQEGEWRHWGSRISGFSSVISEFCYISDSVAISTLNCCTFY